MLQPGKAACLKALSRSPSFPVTLPLLQRVPKEPRLQQPSRHQGNGETVEWKRSQEKGNGAGGEFAQPFPWPQGQHQITSPCHLSVPSPASPPRPPCHLQLRPCCCSPYLQERGGKGFFWGCSGPPAPHPFSAGTALSASPQNKHPSPTPLSATGGEREEEEGDEEPSRELIAC